MIKFGLLNRVGYTKELNTNEVVDKLRARGTKVAGEVADKMEEIEYYQIFTNGQDFAVNSRFLVTKQEQKQLEKVLHGNVEEVSAVIGRAGLWEEWTNAKWTKGEDGKIVSKAKSKEQEQSEEFIKSRNANYIARRTAELRRG